MNKYLSYTIVGLLCAATLAVSCRKPAKSGRTDTYSSGVISFASDESFSPIVEEERYIFEVIYPNAKVNPVYTSETEAMNKLLSDSIMLVICSRDFKKEEYENLKARRRVPISQKLAYDGLAIIQNNANRDSCIGVPDFKRILEGEATQWSDIYPGSKLGEITLVFDNKGSSAVHYVEDSILGGKGIASKNVYATNSSPEVIDYVEQHPGAIGIIGSNWLNDKRDTTNVTFKKNIRTMRVSRFSPATLENSWLPYQYYLYNDNYPLIRTVYALINDPRKALPWGFAQFIASPKGQLIILQTGLLPMYGNITVRDVKVSD